MKTNWFSFIFAIVAVFLFPSLYTGVVNGDVKDVSSAISYLAIQNQSKEVDFQTSETSVSLDTLCYMSAESFGGMISNVLGIFLEIKNNQAPGWTYVKEVKHGDSGLSWTLWQNNKDINTYCFVIAGTDELEDIKRYIPMMLNESYCDQMDYVIEAAKNIKNYAKTSINKLYITGHSLGAYLAAYLMSDLVDYSVNPLTTNSRICANDIYNGLTIDKIKGVCFGGPGFYNGKSIKTTALEKVIKKDNLTTALDLLGVENITIKNGQLTTTVPSWVKEKKDNNANKKYDAYIENHINIYDPVAHLCIGENAFTHIGKVSNYEIKRIGSNFFMNAYKALNNSGLEFFKIADMYYHMPHVYINVMNSMVVIK
ncbi:MAG: hypothetical protein IJD48_04765 [Clostridia bacterium]|nr:hypothetical protein [Clostridia bacterium]